MTDTAALVETVRDYVGEVVGWANINTTAEQEKAIAALDTLAQRLADVEAAGRLVVLNLQEREQQLAQALEALREARLALHRIMEEIDAAKPGSNVESIVWDIAQAALAAAPTEEAR